MIFFYGPDQEQNHAASSTFAYVIGYACVPLPTCANDLILYLDKTQNYVINGLFPSVSEIKILEQYFEIKIIHFKFNRIDLPAKSEFFDEEYNLMTYLKDKNYYIPVKGSADPVKVMDDVGVAICPRLLFANCPSLEDRKYIEEYVEATDGLIMSIPEIQSINKRKSLPIAVEIPAKIKRLTHLFYRDLTRKEVILTDFPWELEEFIELENTNRKIDLYIDLEDGDSCRYEKKFNSRAYFLENGAWIRPNKSNPLVN